MTNIYIYKYNELFYLVKIYIMKKQKLINKILIGIWSLVGLVFIVGFAYPMIPLLRQDTTHHFMSDKFYKATWTNVYTNVNTFSEDGKEISIREKIPWATPWNSKQPDHFVLLTPDSVYFWWQKIVWLDPQLVKIAYPKDNSSPLYLYDDNNVYVGTSLVLPRDGESADVVYQQRKLVKEQETNQSN